jgi:hypothetical protein
MAIPSEKHRVSTALLTARRFAQDAFEMVQACASLSNHNLLELLALFFAEKRVVRLVLTDETYPIVREFCRRHDLVQEHSSRKQAPSVRAPTGDTFTVSVDWDDPRGEFFVVVVGRCREDVKGALEFENRDASFRSFGELYEYPPCCVEAYADLERGGEWISAYLGRSNLECQTSIYSNRLATLFDGSTLLPDYFPCRLDCKLTVELGKRYESLLMRNGCDGYLQQARVSLAYPIILRSGSLLQLYGSSQTAESIEYDAAKVRQIGWRGGLPADDVFWKADSVLTSESRLQLLSGEEVLTDEPVELLNNRLLTFT